MEENEAMEGKKLELAMFEQKVLEAIELAEKQKQDSGVISNGQMQFEIQIVKEGKKVKVHAFGEEILTLEDGKFNYNIEGLKSIQEKLAENPEFDYKQFGLPDIEYLEELEKQKEEQQRDEEEKGENEKDEEDLSKKKEQDDPEKEETIDEEKQEIARRYRVSPNQVVHISMNERSKRVTHKDTMAGLTKWSEKYDDIFILPGEDEYSWQTIGVDKDGKEEAINNKQIEGKNPNVTIKILDENSSNEEIKEVRPLAMYEIDNHTSYAIIRDGSGKTQALYCRQEEGRGKEYWGHVIPEAQGKNVKEASVESRDSISAEYHSNYDLSKRGDALEAAKSLEERGFPSKGGKGVQMEEIQNKPEQNRELTKEAIINDLAEKAVASSSMPMAKTAYMKIHAEELNKKAERILTIGEEDDDITYDEAIDREAELTRSEKEENEKGSEDQKLPGQKRGM